MSTPSIAVFPTKFVKGLSGLGAGEAEGVFLTAPVTVDAAFATQYETDAHFIQYLISKDGVIEAQQSRLNKSALPQLLAQGYTVDFHILALDYDNPKHGRWNDDAAKAFTDRVYSLPDGLKPQWFYRTRGGARLVWHLLDPMPVAEAEPRYRGLLKTMADHGIMGDQACADWTRMFRLPMVVRGD